MKKKRLGLPNWVAGYSQGVAALARVARTSGRLVWADSLHATASRRRAPPAAAAGTPGLVVGAGGALRFLLFRPPGVAVSEHLPLMVMLHGCGQDAVAFAGSTRMNRIAVRERFLVIYPEQDRLANPQRCWNWFDTKAGRAQAEAELILKAIDQVCLTQPVDRQRVAVAGLSAGASMAALLVTRHPDRFKALVMHSGIPPGAAHSTLSALDAMRGRRATVPPVAARQQMPPQRWPPLLVIHGAVDAAVSPNNAGAAALMWANAAGARAGPSRQLRRGQRHPMSVTDFKQHGDDVATLVLVAELGHAWSGGAASQPYGDPRGPDASRMAWAFAARQFRARGQAHGQARGLGDGRGD